MPEASTKWETASEGEEEIHDGKEFSVGEPPANLSLFSLQENQKYRKLMLKRQKRISKQEKNVRNVFNAEAVVGHIGNIDDIDSILQSMGEKVEEKVEVKKKVKVKKHRTKRSSKEETGKSPSGPVEAPDSMKGVRSRELVGSGATGGREQDTSQPESAVNRVEQNTLNYLEISSLEGEDVPKLVQNDFPAISEIKHVIADDEDTELYAEDRNYEIKGEGYSNSDYVKRIRGVSQEIAREEFCKRKNQYEKLLNEKETAVIHLERSIEEVTVDTSKFHKLEDDIQTLHKKGEILDEEIRELDEMLQDLKSRKQKLNLEKRVFDIDVDEKSEKSRSLKHDIDLRKNEIEKLRQNITEINIQMEEVLKTKKSTDPFTDHLDKEIAQKSRELECPVCLIVCQPPILRCPLDHLVCQKCRSKLSVCGECRQQFKGEDRHRYAERSFEDLQRLLKTREEHVKNI